MYIQKHYKQTKISTQKHKSKKKEIKNKAYKKLTKMNTQKQKTKKKN